MAEYPLAVPSGTKAFGAIHDNRGVVIGDASGHTYYYDRPETPPSPSCVLPFSHDPDFVDHGTLLDQLRDRCAVPASRTALVGLGGVGKSQLAIEHCHRTAERSPEKWVFWVHASNAVRFEQGIRNIADRVKLAGRSDPQANIFKLVHDWLRDERKGSWALVLDNVDDAGFLQGQPSGGSKADSRPLRGYLPYCQHGSILVTSRNEDAALKLVEYRDIIIVKPMDRADALRLFEKKTGLQVNSSDSTELVAALEYMPLAIIQAAAYISRRAPRRSVREYLEQFQSSDREKTSLLDYEAGQLRRDHDAKNSIILTWHISFDHIRQTGPSATDLLSLMSFFDRQGIPEALVHHREDAQQASSVPHQNSKKDQGKREAERGEVESDRSRLEDDLLKLKDYSFITFSEEGTTFKMHALEQLATRKWLEANGQYERWQQQFLRNLCMALPTGEYENWTVCQVLLPHAKSAAAQQPERHDPLRDWASILYKAAWYMWRLGKGIEAKIMVTQAIEAMKRILGRNHKDTLRGIEMMALVLQNQGEYEAAKEMNRQALEGYEKALGKDHPDTLTSIDNLASVLQYQGKYEAAEEMNRRALEGREKALGKEHPETLISVYCLAFLFHQQREYDAALPLYKRASDGFQLKLGLQHPTTVACSQRHSALMWEMGKIQ